MMPPEYRDKMTGLYNCNGAAEMLRRMVETSGPDSVGVIRANIFHLKTPHDKYGHPPIDEVIVEVGQIVQQHAHLQDIASRYGGNEYLIIVPHAHADQLRERAEQLKQAANQLHVFSNGQAREKIRLSVGIGLCHFEGEFNWEAPALEIIRVLVEATEQDFQRSRNLYLQQEQ